MDSVPADTEAYSVDLPIPGFDEIPAGCSVLVTGPPMIGKAELASELLADGLAAGQNTVVLGADDAPGRVLDANEALANGFESGRVYFVNATGVSGEVESSSQVQGVSHPGDLTGLGISMVKSMQEIAAAGRNGVRTGVFSVSTLLQYNDVDRVFDFLHVLTGRIAASNYLAVATLAPGRHDEAAVNSITAQFDGVLQLREGDAGVRELRAKGFAGVDREWVALD